MNQEKFEEAYIRSNAHLAFVMAEAISGKGVFRAAEKRPGTKVKTGETATGPSKTLTTKSGSTISKVKVLGSTGYGITSKRGKYRYLGTDDEA